MKQVTQVVLERTLSLMSCERKLKALNDGPKLVLEGKTIDLLLIEGRTYAPVREFLETAGYEVHWDGKIRRVTARK